MADDKPEDTIAEIAAKIWANGARPDEAPARMVERLVRDLRVCMKILTPESRLAVWSALQGDYCTHCGTDDPRCQCWNDE